MKKYLVKFISYPQSQHPDRYLDIVTDNIEKTMEEFQYLRHPLSYYIEEQVDTDIKEPYCKIIKYKYSEHPPIGSESSEPKLSDGGNTSN